MEFNLSLWYIAVTKTLVEVVKKNGVILTQYQLVFLANLLKRHHCQPKNKCEGQFFSDQKQTASRQRLCRKIIGPEKMLNR